MIIKRGQYKIVRPDGSEEMVDKKPTLEALYEAIGCDCVDIVRVGSRDSQQVMIVDDNGLLNNLPINDKATALYWQFYNTTSPIVGTVVLANDADFGDEDE